MKIPTTVPGLKLATIFWAIYAVIWIALEGNLVQVLLLAGWLVLVLAGHLIQRYAGGRTLSSRRLLPAGALLGLMAGLNSGVLALVLMAVKSGLHAHGPEFTRSELLWVLQQTPLWSVAGLLAGLGLALLVPPPPADSD